MYLIEYNFLQLICGMPKRKKHQLTLMVDPDDLSTLRIIADRRGFSTVQEFIRTILHQEAGNYEHNQKKQKPIT